jgi:hypothetical protein
MARVRRSLGTYILAGCSSDQVSYEASRYRQGYLTYALLEGMKVGTERVTREGNLLEVNGLLNYALRRVPEIARGNGGIQDPQLSVPDSATPIDLGRLTARATAAITLAEERPLFVRPTFGLEDRPGDPQKLSAAVTERLTRATRDDGDLPLTFVEVEEGTGAYRIAGRYSVHGDSIRVRVFVSRFADEGEVSLGDPLEATGAAGALPDLAERITRAAYRTAIADYAARTGERK